MKVNISLDELKSFFRDKKRTVQVCVSVQNISQNRQSLEKNCRDAIASRQAFDCYLTVIVRVVELGSVSVPPGPKLTVPNTLNTALDVPAAGCTF